MIVIDTHVWVYLISEQSEKLSKPAQKAIREADVLLLSPFSCWEVTLLVKTGRLELEIDVRRWISNGLKFPKLRLAEMNPAILTDSVLFDDLHSDPADRIIAATCLFYNVPLITKDSKLHRWNQIETIW